ncbi:hypothetical protein T12_13530 [Trichinella patagoniensis]|uniref:C2H2-type domain-containing protein n=1 Tax=Trichinella patagoniensis TaxID=990121 RepID=A0A0V1AC37_9BILA|nr:hypothetical protein T12_13530 [Trichinella patagoniensis]
MLVKTERRRQLLRSVSTQNCFQHLILFPKNGSQILKTTSKLCGFLERRLEQARCSIGMEWRCCKILRSVSSNGHANPVGGDNVTFQCSECGYELQDADSLWNHIRTGYLFKKECCCRICLAIFAKLVRLERACTGTRQQLFVSLLGMRPRAGQCRKAWTSLAHPLRRPLPHAGLNLSGVFEILQRPHWLVLVHC